MIIYHGSKEEVKTPAVRKSKYNKDFYYGFYCTLYEEQAFRWAIRITGKGVMNIYDYTAYADLKIKSFSEMTEEWLDFVVNCRNGVPHDYDIVEGPMADDQVYNYVQEFLDGNISRAAFWELAKFKKPTHQISFHTPKALKSVKFIRSYEVSDER